MLPSDSTEALAEALALPSVTVDGTTYTAQTRPKLRDVLPYLRAVEGKESLADQLAGAQQILMGSGIPPEVVADMDVGEVVDAATRFFLAALTSRASPPAT
jgi:hypothetical protein